MSFEGAPMTVPVRSFLCFSKPKYRGKCQHSLFSVFGKTLSDCSIGANTPNSKCKGSVCYFPYRDKSIFRQGPVVCIQVPWPWLWLWWSSFQWTKPVFLGHGPDIHASSGSCVQFGASSRTAQWALQCSSAPFPGFGLLWVSFSTSVTRSGRYIFYQLINFWLLSEVKYSRTRNEHIFIVRNCWQMQAYACLFKVIYSAQKSTWQLKTPVSFLKARYAPTKHVLYKHTWQLATPISWVLKAT